MSTRLDVTPLPNLTKEQAVYDQLRQAIVSGPLKPGQRLIPGEIGVQFQVSSMPVRNALMRLESDRLIVRAPHKEYLVAPYSLQEIKEIFAIRALLEGYAARLAVENVTPEKLKELRGILARSQEKLEEGDLNGLATSNHAFHFALYGCCRNEQLVDLIESLRDRAARYRFVYYSTRRTLQEQLQEHWETLRAVESGDATHAEELTRKHMERIRDSLLSTIEPART